MVRIRSSIKRHRWRLLLAAPALLIFAIAFNWAPIYILFVVDVALVTYAFTRPRVKRRS